MIRTFTHLVEPRGHCATICPHHKGILLAYYNGPECSDNQAVNVEYWEEDKLRIHTRLSEKTGNCILWAINQNEAGLIFSLFEDTDGAHTPESPVQRWMFCSNWQIKVRIINNALEEQEFQKMPLIIGHLVRCQPIIIKKTWYLPMYREHNCKGVIMKAIDGWQWVFTGTIGNNIQTESGRFGNGVLIQPTIWHDGTKFHSLSRDVSRTKRAWYSSSRNGSTWTEPIKTNLWNDNNSVVAIQDGTAEPWLVWNHGPGRGLLTLGIWNKEEMSAKPLLILNRSHNASYPNYCFDYDNNLHIVHTDGPSIIRHVLNKNMLNQLLEMNISTPKFLKDLKEWELVSNE